VSNNSYNRSARLALGVKLIIVILKESKQCMTKSS